MPFASINSTSPRINLWNFHKNIENWKFWKTRFVWVCHFDFSFRFFFSFLLHFHKNQSKVLGCQEWVGLLMITLVSSQKSLPPNISAPRPSGPNVHLSSIIHPSSFMSVVLTCNISGSYLTIPILIPVLKERGFSTLNSLKHNGVKYRIQTHHPSISSIFSYTF